MYLPESIERFVEDQAFSPSYDLEHRKTEKERQLAQEKGGKRVGEEPNHTTAKKPGPL